MINALHLLWIVPLAAAFGFVFGAIMAVGKKAKILISRNNIKT